MDKLIEDYKKELIEDEACGYGYPTGLKNRIINEIEINKFAIPVEKVQAMIDSVREENANTSDSGSEFDIKEIELFHFAIIKALPNTSKKPMDTQQ